MTEVVCDIRFLEAFMTGDGVRNSEHGARVFRARKDGEEVRVTVAPRFRQSLFVTSPLATATVVLKRTQRPDGTLSRNGFFLQRILGYEVDPGDLRALAIAHWAVYSHPPPAPKSKGKRKRDDDNLETAGSLADVALVLFKDTQKKRQFQRLKGALQKQFTDLDEQSVAVASRVFCSEGFSDRATQFFRNITRHPVYFRASLYCCPRWIEFADANEVRRLVKAVRCSMNAGYLPLVCLAVGLYGVRSVLGETTDCPPMGPGFYQFMRETTKQPLPKMLSACLEIGEYLAFQRERISVFGNNVFSMENKTNIQFFQRYDIPKEDVSFVVEQLCPRWLRKLDDETLVFAPHYAMTKTLFDHYPRCWSAVERACLRDNFARKDLDGIPFTSSVLINVACPCFNDRVRWIQKVMETESTQTRVMVTDGGIARILHEDHGIDTYVAPWYSEDPEQFAGKDICVLGAEHLGLDSFTRMMLWLRAVIHTGKQGAIALVSDAAESDERTHALPPSPFHRGGGAPLRDLILKNAIPSFRKTCERPSEQQFLHYGNVDRPDRFVEDWLHRTEKPRILLREQLKARHGTDTDCLTEREAKSIRILASTYAHANVCAQDVCKYTGTHIRINGDVFVINDNDSACAKSIGIKEGLPGGTYKAKKFRIRKSSTSQTELENVPFLRQETFQRSIPVHEIYVEGWGTQPSGWVSRPVIPLLAHSVSNWPEAAAEVVVLILSEKTTLHEVRSAFTRATEELVLVGTLNDLIEALERKNSRSTWRRSVTQLLE